MQIQVQIIIPICTTIELNRESNIAFVQVYCTMFLGMVEVTYPQPGFKIKLQISFLAATPGARVGFKLSGLCVWPQFQER